MPTVYDYDDETDYPEYIDDSAERTTFPDYVFELEFPTR